MDESCQTADLACRIQNIAEDTRLDPPSTMPNPEDYTVGCICAITAEYVAAQVLSFNVNLVRLYKAQASSPLAFLISHPSDAQYMDFRLNMSTKERNSMMRSTRSLRGNRDYGRGASAQIQQVIGYIEVTFSIPRIVNRLVLYYVATIYLARFRGPHTRNTMIIQQFNTA